MLRHRWFFLAVVCLGLVLALPSLGVGFVADDYTFIERLEDPHEQATFRLYEFATGAPEQAARLLSTRWVAYPWWIAEGFKVRFMRPLASGLFALDHALFGRAPLGYHVHCLLWYGSLLVAVGLLLRRICAPPVWQLAFLLFALSASHGESFAWISSRHVLIATVPALFGLLALIEHAERGWRLGSVLGMLGMVVGLLGSEAALPVACYWLAYAAFGAPDTGDERRRLARLALPVGCLAAYLLFYKWLGYGVAESGSYLDPISMPRAFWSALPARLAMLLAEAWASFPSGLALSALPVVGTVVGAVMTAAVALLVRAIWPQLEPAERRTLRWLSIGALLALLISAGAFLGPRLLLIPGISAFVVIATIFQRGWRVARSPVGKLASRALVVCLAAVHFAWAPLGLALNAYLIGKLGVATESVDASVDEHFRQHLALAQKPPRVFVLVASDPFTAFYGAAVRSVRAPELSDQWSMVSMTRGTHHIERTGPSQLVIRVEPSMLHSTFEGLFRPLNKPFFVGDQAAMPGAFVTVLAVAAGHPTTIRLTLTSGSFDDNDVCLLAWREQRLVPVQLELHQKLSIPWSAGPTGLL
jgi:hypothetical protein